MVEVKSITRLNEAHQVRLGLGQVVDDAASLEAAGHHVVPVLATSVEVTPGRWDRACARAGVRLVAPSGFDRLVAEV